LFYVLHRVVEPALAERGLPAVHARIGIDHGQLLLARIGVPTGTARLPRNSLVAVGPAAIIASRLQGLASTDEIWVGDAMRSLAPAEWHSFFQARIPEHWPWVFGNDSSKRYWVWKFAASMIDHALLA